MLSLLLWIFKRRCPPHQFEVVMYSDVRFYAGLLKDRGKCARLFAAEDSGWFAKNKKFNLKTGFLWMVRISLFPQPGMKKG